MSPEFSAIGLGLVCAVVSVAPLWLVFIQSLKPGSWFRRNDVYAAIGAQAISLVILVAAIVVCQAVAEGMLLWFSLPAILGTMAQQVACALLRVVLRKGR